MNRDREAGVFYRKSPCLSFTAAHYALTDRAHVQKQIEIARYENVIQQAFRDVADGLAGQRTLNDRVQSEQRAVEASQIAYELAGLRFQEGVDDYLTLLDTHRMLYGAQQRLVRTRLMQQLNIISLYKALGGGWRNTARKSKVSPNSARVASAARALNRHILPAK